MAFCLSQSPIPPASSARNPITSPKLPSPFKSTLNPIQNLRSKNHHHRHRFAVVRHAAAEDQQKPPTPEPEPPSDSELSELGTEIKNAMMERDAAKKDEKMNIFNGVAEEIGKIEWPAFNKVVGTTGVVLGVIAGSSVVLLTVNAVLAEISDRVFAGRGVQDFFG
ncbi:hypothetical protein SSX86_015361 [Deinandra increscens subsp. villosa]|uniref:Preprotein translocase subunit SECE1 n=1 Tax=Deinandra increscens subsp. villosa TaxID=3103831 RepID=A0AAP0CZX8_9ASTR